MNTSDDARDGLSALGWDEKLEQAFAAAAPHLAPARVVAEHRGRFVLARSQGEHLSAVLSGRLRHETTQRIDRPAVGDWVGIDTNANDVALITVVLPRRSAFVRKVAGDETQAQVVAANVDSALILSALPEPVNGRRFERYLTLAWESGALPTIVLTKRDLCDDPSSSVRAAQNAAPGVDVLTLSAVTGEGVATLERLLHRGQTAVLLGPSGAGKSSLLNRLLGHEHLRTGAVRDDGKGRHTTTHRELVTLSGGAMVIDTPGMRELQLWDAGSGLAATFADLEEIARACRFRDCRHDAEPGCAVRAAVADGRLVADRLYSWHKLRRELAYLERRRDAAAEADYRSEIRAIHRSARKHIRRKYD